MIKLFKRLINLIYIHELMMVEKRNQFRLAKLRLKNINSLKKPIKLQDTFVCREHFQLIYKVQIPWTNDLIQRSVLFVKGDKVKVCAIVGSYPGQRVQLYHMRTLNNPHKVAPIISYFFDRFELMLNFERISKEEYEGSTHQFNNKIKILWK